MLLFPCEHFHPFRGQQKQSSESLLDTIHTRLSGSLTVASSSLQAWSAQFLSSLPDPLQAFVRNVTALHPDSPPTPFLDQIYSAITASPATYTTLAATLLGLIYLVTKYLMSSYRSGYENGWGGRRSPYTSGTNSTLGRNVSDFVEYITGSNEMLAEDGRPSAYDPRPSVGRPHVYTDPDDAPDILHLRHKAKTYEFHFQPFAIGDGDLTIGDIKKHAAETLHTDSRRIRLFYKGKKLLEDDLPAKKYGLKQQSEISCVIAEVVNSGDSVDSGSDSDGRRGGSSHSHTGRPRGLSTARQRSGEQLPTQSDYLRPTATRTAETPRPTERPTRHETLNVPSHHDRPRSLSRGTSPNPATTSNSSINSNAPPDTPLGKLQLLATTFHTKFLPPCTKFILSPPTDERTRHQEHAKLNESVLAQVVLKADNVDVEGDGDARAFRKGLVNEANEVMRKLDMAKAGR